MTTRAAQRKKKQRLKRKKHIIKALQFIIIVGVVYALIFLTPFFKVAGIVVEGATVTSTQSVITASGIYNGQHLLQINQSASKAEIEKLAYVKTAQVKRVFPNKVKIILTEASVFANVAIPGGFACIDETGKVMEITQSPKDPSPVINGLAVQKNDIGLKIVIDEQYKLDVILKYMTLLNGQALPCKYNSITLDGSGIWADFENGVRVLFGDDDTPEYKVAAFAESLRNAGDLTGGFFNVSVPERIVYSPYLPGEEEELAKQAEEENDSPEEFGEESSDQE